MWRGALCRCGSLCGHILAATKCARKGRGERRHGPIPHPAPARAARPSMSAASEVVRALPSCVRCTPTVMPLFPGDEDELVPASLACWWAVCDRQKTSAQLQADGGAPCRCSTARTASKLTAFWPGCQARGGATGGVIPPDMVPSTQGMHAQTHASAYLYAHRRTHQHTLAQPWRPLVKAAAVGNVALPICSGGIPHQRSRVARLRRRCDQIGQGP